MAMISTCTSSLLLRDFSFFKRRDGKEIPVQQEQGIPKSMDSAMNAFHYLYNMEITGNIWAFPLPCGLEAVMELDA